ncbi:MAG: hypothetical protein IJQ87_02100 [Clostridia bacterium]|nr:hypothetical protein [Clostridia bacterium]
MRKSLTLFLIMLLCIMCFCALGTGCGGDSPNTNANPAQTGEITDGETDEQQLETMKAETTANLDNSVNSLRSKITDDDLKNAISAFYQKTKNDISSVNSIDNAKALLNQIKADIATFVENTISAQISKLKSNIIAELDEIVAAGLNKLSNDSLKQQLNNFYNTEKTTITALETLDGLPSALTEIKVDVENFIKEIITQQLTALKEAAVANLDNSVNALLAKISDEDLRAEINSFYQQTKNNIVAVNSIDSAKTAFDKILADTSTFVNNTIKTQLEKLKVAAFSELDKIVTAGLSKLKDEQLKTQLNEFYSAEKSKITAVDDIDNIPAAVAEVSEDIKDFATKLVASEIAELRATVKGYLNTVVQSFNASPYDFIPAAMTPRYAANFVAESDVSYDFSNFVNVSTIKYGGFGKQWNMVIDNINQSEYFYKYLNVGNTVLSSALTTITSYLESEYADSIDKSFETEHFSASIAYNSDTFYYTLNYNTGVNVPLFGNVSPTISMIYNIISGEKTYTVKLTDTNRLRYTVSENKYEFGIEYGISTGSRTSYLSIERKSDDTVEGHIYEYITLSGHDVVPSCADFYIDNTYVSVVGNKADAMMVAKDYINELYKKNEGKLLGYEVRETLSFPIIGSTDYNTLWFNLDDISGINTIKADFNDKGELEAVYVNDNSTAFSPTHNKKYGVKTSRKYDIEFRTQYFYGLDDNGNLKEYEVIVPMMFIQEDNDKDNNYSTYSADIFADNGITSTVIIDANVLNKIMEDYDLLIDEFINNKQMMGSTVIKAYIES